VLVALMIHEYEFAIRVSCRKASFLAPFAEEFLTTATAAGNSQRLQELDDGFSVIPLQLFKLLTYAVCFAMVAQNRVVKRQ
jgi:hypothetical protein